MRTFFPSRPLSRKLAGVSSIVLGLGLGAVPALADAPAGQAASGAGSGLAEIVVTARKVAENQQRVPVSVSAFSGAALQAQSAATVGEVARFTPGLTIMQGSSNPTVLIFSIRGQVQSDNLATLEPSVGTYVDGLYVARAYGINASLVDISSVQVLKGPQGTLFGRNTSAGALLINTNDPNLSKISEAVTATYGRFNEADASAVVNLPLVTDTLALRGAFQYNSRDGYITDVKTGAKYDNVDRFSARVKALWKPASNVSVLAAGEWFQDISNGPARTMAYGGPMYAGVNEIGAYLGAVAPGTTLPTGASQAALDAPPYEKTRTQTYSLTTSVEESYGTYKLIGGYRKVSSLADVDLSGAPVPLLDTNGLSELHQWSLEFQLTGKILDRKLDYAVGATYFTEAGTDLSAQTTLGLDPSGSEALAAPTQLYGQINNKSWGIYGQSTYHATDRLSFTAGLRYSVDHKYLMSHNINLPYFNVESLSAVGGSCAITDTSVVYSASLPNSQNCAAGHGDTFNSLSYLFSVDYKIAPDVLIYAKASKGYRSGGENLRASGPLASFAPFLPETNYEEEIGLKSEFFNHKVRLNVGAYYNDVHNKQFTDVLLDSSSGALLTELFNAGLARNMGFEAELAVRVTNDLTFQATGNVNSSKYLQFELPVAVGSSTLANHTSDFFEQDPKGTFTIAGNYKHQFNAVNVTGRIDYSWSASYYNDPANTNPVQTGPGTVVYLSTPAAEVAAFTTPAAGILGARIGFGFNEDRYTIAFWGKNLTNNRDFVSSFNVAALGLVSAIRRDPASYGVTAGAKF